MNPLSAATRRGRPHKLTEVERRDIRQLYATGSYSQARLAAMFGVSQPTIHRVVNPEAAR